MKTVLLAISLLFAASSAFAQTTAPDSLARFRTQIDSLDRQVIQLLGKRMDVVRQVGAYKARRQMDVVQPARFEAILKKNVAIGAQNGLSEGFITELMHAIHAESIGQQEQLQPAAKK